MHHIAHRLSQTDSFEPQATGRSAATSQPVAARIADDGQFGESLKASVGATMPITTPKLTKVGDEGERQRDAVHEEPDVVKVSTTRGKIIRTRQDVAQRQSHVQGAATGAKVVAAKKDAPCQGASAPATPEQVKPAAAEDVTQAPVQSVAIVPGQQVVVQAADAQPSAPQDVAVAPGATVHAQPSSAVGAAPIKPTKDEGKPGEGSASGAGLSGRADAGTQIAVQPQTVPQLVTAPSGPGYQLTGPASALPHHSAIGIGNSVASPAKNSEVTPAGLIATAGTPATSDGRTLIATPTVLEVGVASGSHGWLRVRAELDRTGEVAASVLAGSQGVADGLHRELPAISAYLSDEQVGVGSLVVHTADKGVAAQDPTTSSGGGGSESGSSRHRQQDSTGWLAASSSEAVSAIDEADFGPIGVSAPAAVFANGTGSWLSVRV